MHWTSATHRGGREGGREVIRTSVVRLHVQCSRRLWLRLTFARSTSEFAWSFSLRCSILTLLNLNTRPSTTQSINAVVGTSVCLFTTDVFFSFFLLLSFCATSLFCAHTRHPHGRALLGHAQGGMCVENAKEEEEEGGGGAPFD